MEELPHRNGGFSRARRSHQDLRTGGLRAASLRFYRDCKCLCYQPRRQPHHHRAVAGHISTRHLKKMIQDGGGKATLTTVEGGTLTAWMKDGKYMLTGEKGGMATITIPNVYQSNGVIQVIDAVLMP